jgi:hypothetical protein
MDIDNESSSAQRSNEEQSQLLEANTAVTMQQIMQQMMQQMIELMTRVEKVEKKETTATTADAEPAIPTAIPIPTPVANTTYTYEPKGLKDPDAFDGTRSQYLLWKY